MTRNLIAFMLLSGRLVTPLAAQGPRALPAGTAWGVTLDQFNLTSEHYLTTVTLHIASLKPNSMTTQFGLMLIPEILGEGGVAANLDLGGALNLVLPDATLLVRGGATGLFVIGGDGGGALPGLHYGASLLVKAGQGVGLRLDVTRRVYIAPYDFNNSIPTLSIGIGITSLPQAK